MQKRKTSRLVTAVAIAALGPMTLGACSPRMLGDVARTALWTATIVGYVAILQEHDAHFHYENCGHYRRYHDDHWVYYYQGRWEYYDDSSTRWYYYVDE